MTKPIKFDKHQETQLIAEIQSYCEANLEPITDLQAYLFLDFLTKTVGNACYNLAIEESYAYLQTQLDDLFVLQKN
ncbi:MAG: DUF2164 family protein [Culicoidibacterales bacterium]